MEGQKKMNWLRWIKLLALLMDVIAALIVSGVVFSFRSAIVKEKKIDDIVLQAIDHDNKLVTLAVVLIVASFVLFIFCEIMSQSTHAMMISDATRAQMQELADQVQLMPKTDITATLQDLFRSISREKKLSK